MKKVWNVYEDKDGARFAVTPGSKDDAYYLADVSPKDTLVFLGQVTEEIEEPKKEVEKVVDVLPSFSFNSRHAILTVNIPPDSYGHKLHYKIKE